MKKNLDSLLTFLSRLWQEITLAILCFCFILLTISILQTSPAVSAFKVSDWGLGFGPSGTTPSGNVSSQELAAYNAYYVGDTSQKIIYLTFDAGYENGYTAGILDILKKHQVPATFFLVKHYLDTQPDLVRRMAQEGHIVANHTATHPDMSKLTSARQLEAELTPVKELYKELTGQEMLPLYRPPQGKFSEKNLQDAKDLGYTTVFWSLAYADWDNNKQPDPAASIQKLTSRLHPGAIVLLHSTSATNATILEELITTWKALGYEFRPLSDLLLS